MKNRLPFRRGLTPGHKESQSELLTEGVFDSNIDRETSGQLRIALWKEWASMLEDLHQVGPVWSVVRNGHCVLSVHGAYPKLSLSSDRQSAHARDEERSLRCHFRAWQQAVAFESKCCCGRVSGLEIENGQGDIFHRICLEPGIDQAPFAEWIQTHQATGLEEEDELPLLDQGRFHPQSFAPKPGTLQVLPQVLRPVLITAAEREISIMAGVLSEGVTQSTLLDIHRASEAQGWLMLSGLRCSLYVESEPRGTVYVEPITLEGESTWRLSFLSPEGARVMSLQPAIDDRAPWNQLVTDRVLQR